MANNVIAETFVVFKSFNNVDSVIIGRNSVEPKTPKEIELLVADAENSNIQKVSFKNRLKKIMIIIYS